MTSREFLQLREIRNFKRIAELDYIYCEVD